MREKKKRYRKVLGKGNRFKQMVGDRLGVTLFLSKIGESTFLKAREVARERG